MPDYDSPWKEVADQHLRELLADKVVKVWSKAGDERYLHVEVQAQSHEGFERRLFEYHYHIDDRFGLPPETVVILADEDANWRPTRYVVSHDRVRLTFEFDPVKILDWEPRKDELREHPNPVALFVLAHLEARRTAGDPAERARVKLDLILRLHDRKLDPAELRHWYRCLDWLLELPKEYEYQLWDEIERIEQEKKMPFITFAERHGLERGLEKGERQGLLKGIGRILELKFGEAGLALMPDVERKEKLEILQAILDAIGPETTIDDVKRLLA